MGPHRSEFNTYIRFHQPKHLPEDEGSFSRNVASLKNMIQDKTNCSFESIKHTESTNLNIFRNTFNVSFQFFQSSSEASNTCRSHFHRISSSFAWFKTELLILSSFSSHLTSLLASVRHAISTNVIVLLTVPSNVRSGLFAVQFILIRCSQSQNSFSQLFSITFLCSHLISYHLVPSGSSPLSIAHFTARTFRALSCGLTYSVPANFLHPDNRCCTVSLYSPHNRHLSSFTNPLIFFHALVWIICSCSANIDAVFQWSVLHFNQA